MIPAETSINPRVWLVSGDFFNVQLTKMALSDEKSGFDMGFNFKVFPLKFNAH